MAGYYGGILHNCIGVIKGAFQTAKSFIIEKLIGWLFSPLQDFFKIRDPPLAILFGAFFMKRKKGFPCR